MTIFPKVYQLMQEKGLTNVLLTGGGIIPEEDSVQLRDMGIGTLFAPGANTADIASYIKDWVAAHQQ
jgi:methylmalonyl-CoA mutase C-terminal domain/subunit